MSVLTLFTGRYTTNSMARDVSAYSFYRQVTTNSIARDISAYSFYRKITTNTVAWLGIRVQ